MRHLPNASKPALKRTTLGTDEHYQFHNSGNNLSCRSFVASAVDQPVQAPSTDSSDSRGSPSRKTFQRAVDKVRRIQSIQKNESLDRGKCQRGQWFPVLFPLHLQAGNNPLKESVANLLGNAAKNVFAAGRLSEVGRQ